MALQDTGGHFSIKYGTGTVNGTVVTDVLRVADPPIIVPDQGFGLATEHSADFASASCDGIFVRFCHVLSILLPACACGAPGASVRLGECMPCRQLAHACMRRLHTEARHATCTGIDAEGDVTNMGDACIVMVDSETLSCQAQGLALPALSKQGQLPAFFRMLESGLLDEPLFSVWLSPDPTTEPAGKIMFGGHNPQRYVGMLQDLPVTSKKCARSSTL